MALPGLDVTDSIDSSTILTRELKPNQEFRFEVAPNTSITIRLTAGTAGTAELFGTELSKGLPYTFTCCKSAIYTWTGCSLSIEGSPSVEYIAEETPMTTYLNLHIALEKLRVAASDCPPTTEGAQGPRILLIGPPDVGKTTVAKILTGYSIRQGRKPMVINLDTGGEGVLSVPGTITAASFGSVMDVEDGFGNSPMSAPSAIPVKLPLVYYYGLETPEGGVRRYKRLISRMAVAVNSRLEEDIESKNTGLIIDTPSFDNQTNGDLISYIVAEFSITTIAILGSERLYNTMLKSFSASTNINVIKLPTSGGCVDRDVPYKKSLRDATVKKYFFGDDKCTLSPYTVSIELDSPGFSLWETVDSSSDRKNISFLPIGEDESSLQTGEDDVVRKLAPGDVDSRFENLVVAVLQVDAKDAGVKEVAESAVLGFLFVQEIDEKERRMKVLSPVPGRVPSKALLVGKWPDGMFLT
ncbi:Cleavage polyadenylation factor subunit clp1 [Orbilia oligospora]|uniref:Polynucleotide 5'-hydroxyl-kinase GRC3 n=1 Tax=Orbilia oligospora TaxID=2813651 RepID=A0A7C8PSI3_ORBOL|nr:Cleavage polyadenylation factor subunit clp1 [Orbilia oligospora]KAF3096739.1 Cleavage polyadenylation factor subunit clp1 [Orbilia oligospora]KAF3116488.1 Cleavage polyadenylation factor subunit clp1 [Orbilia oligospora]KAF3120038.1 Cleavage polyadenylation factor subunit clp1 [Orbilia oligospora]KAF3136415.1 Cleavage polyadenylation factor subunit clp1 [Orbilia oligospora]